MISTVVSIIGLASSPSKLPNFQLRLTFYGIGQPKTGHVVSQLLIVLRAPQDLVDKAKYLDKLYIPIRYPDAWENENPSYYYTKREAEEAIKYAEEIVKYIEEKWRTLSQEEKERGEKS